MTRHLKSSNLKRTLETIKIRTSAKPGTQIISRRMSNDHLSYKTHAQMNKALAEFETQKAEIIEILRRRNF